MKSSNVYRHTPRWNPRLKPRNRCLSDSLLNGSDSSAVSTILSNCSTASSLLLTPCRSESSASLRKWEQYPNLYHGLSCDSSFNASPVASTLTSLSNSTSSLEESFDEIEHYKEWPLSPIRPDHSTHLSWVTTDFGTHSACHPASVSGYGRGLCTLNLSATEESFSDQPVVTSSNHRAIGFQVFGTFEMTDAYNSYNDLDFDETTASERLANRQNLNSKIVQVANPSVRPPSFRAPLPPHAIEDNTYENLTFDKTTNSERKARAKKIVTASTPAQNAIFRAPAASQRLSEYNSYDDLPFDDTTYSERNANPKNAAVFIPAPPTAPLPVFRAPMLPKQHKVTTIKIKMRSNSKSPIGMETMLREIKTGKAKLPVDQNTTVGTDFFGDDREFLNFIDNGPDVSGLRHSKRKTRIPKIAAPVPMKKFVLRSSTPISSPTHSKSTEGSLLNSRSSAEKRRRESTDAQFSPESPKTHRRSEKSRKSKKRSNHHGKYSKRSIEDIYRRYPSISSQDSGVSAHRIESGTDTDDNMGIRMSRHQRPRGRGVMTSTFDENAVVFRNSYRNGFFATEIRSKVPNDHRRHQSAPRKTTEVFQGTSHLGTPRRNREPTGASIKMHSQNIHGIDSKFALHQEVALPKRPYFSFEPHVKFPEQLPASHNPKPVKGDVLTTPRRSSKKLGSEVGSSMRPSIPTEKSDHAEKPRILSTPGEIFSAPALPLSLDITDLPPPVGQIHSPLNVTPDYANFSAYRYLALNEDGATRREMNAEERFAVNAENVVKFVSAKVMTPAPAVLEAAMEVLAPAVPEDDVSDGESTTDMGIPEVKKELAGILEQRIEHLKSGKEAEYSELELAMLTKYHRTRILKIRSEAPGANMEIMKILVLQAVEDRLKKTDDLLIHLAYEVLFEVWDDVLGFEIQYLLNQQANPEFESFEADFFSL